MKMKKFLSLALAIIVMAPAIPVGAAVTLTVSPMSMVSDPVLIKSSSDPLPLFSFALSSDAAETLTSVKLRLDQKAGLVTSSDFNSASVWRDDGNGSFSAGSDTQLESTAPVQVGSDTTLGVASTTAATGKFYVALRTSGTISSGDAFTASLPADAIIASANSPTSSAVTTATITADVIMPSASSAAAQNTGGTSAKEAGDSVKVVFSEATNKPAINSGNITSVFSLSGGHSFKDASGNLGTASWNVAGTELSISLSNTGATTSTLPTVEPGDTLTVSGGSILTDLAGNSAQGAVIITGSFTATSTSSGGGDDDDDDHKGKVCSNSLINGRLYKVKGQTTVYLAAACRLKPFRGEAVFKARGKKFQNIIELDSIPGNVTVSERPVLPAVGALIKGTNATVWFVGSDGKRHGFRSAEIFLALGFKFSSVQTISDQDVSVTGQGTDVASADSHPDGTLMICENSPAVFQVEGKKKFGFRTADAFLSRGHSWENLVKVNCKAFGYVTGSPVE